MVAEQGHVLGLNDVMMERNYTLSVRCASSAGILLKISSSDFHSCIDQSLATVNLLESMCSDIDKTTMKQIR